MRTQIFPLGQRNAPIRIRHAGVHGCEPGLAEGEAGRIVYTDRNRLTHICYDLEISGLDSRMGEAGLLNNAERIQNLYATSSQQRNACIIANCNG